VKYAIVTGVSTGLGESVEGLLLEAGIDVIGISRSTNDHLPELAKGFNRSYSHFACDLSDIDTLEKTLDHIHEEIYTEEPSTVYLINNAAVVSPVNQAMNIKSEELSDHVQVNMIAPMLLTNQCLKKANETNSAFVSANITSGAAVSPMFGWSAYCSTKAGMNMYAKTVALEQEELQTENKIIAFDPGVMDTNMQAEIRSSSEAEFPEIERFKEYKEKNILNDPGIVAGVLVDILTDEVNLENGKIYSVKDYL